MSNTDSDSRLNSLFRLFKSVKLAIVLILIIVVTSLISTLIPQNKELAYYTENYGKFLSSLITATGFDSFFSSLLFMIPSFLFFINLSFCTFDRLSGRIKRNAKKRFGPDILHIGLLILIIGGLFTATGKQEAFVRMGEGDTVDLAGGYTIELTTFEFLKYDNGRPKDWISTVRLEKDGEVIKEAFPIEVNNPLKAGNKKIYQMSYTASSFLYISDPDGNQYKLKSGQAIPEGEGVMVFRSVLLPDSGSQESTAVFERHNGEEAAVREDLTKGEKIDKYTISGMDVEMTSGLQIVDDPGYYIVFIGLILLTIGLFLTYYQKLGDNKI